MCEIVSESIFVHDLPFNLMFIKMEIQNYLLEILNLRPREVNFFFPVESFFDFYFISKFRSRKSFLVQICKLILIRVVWISIDQLSKSKKRVVPLDYQNLKITRKILVKEILTDCSIFRGSLSSKKGKRTLPGIH